MGDQLAVQVVELLARVGIDRRRKRQPVAFLGRAHLQRRGIEIGRVPANDIGNRLREAVLLNAGGAVAAGGHARDLEEGYRVAGEALDSGAAGERLEELIAFSRAKEVAA